MKVYQIFKGKKLLQEGHSFGVVTLKYRKFFTLFISCVLIELICSFTTTTYTSFYVIHHLNFFMFCSPCVSI